MRNIIFNNEEVQKDSKVKDIKNLFLSGIVKGLMVSCIAISLVGCKKENVSTSNKIESTASADKKEEKVSNNGTNTDNTLSTSESNVKQVKRKGFYEEEWIHYSNEELSKLDVTNISTKKVDMSALKDNYFVKLDSDTNWEIDLDGDGKTEQVCLKFYSYIFENNNENFDYGIYINNDLYAHGHKTLDFLYVIDIDSSDNKYELLYNGMNLSAIYYVAHAWDNGKFIENIFSWDANYTTEILHDNFKDILNIDNTPGLIARRNVSQLYDPFLMDNYHQYNSNDYSFEIVVKEEVGLKTINLELFSEMKEYDKLELYSEITVYEKTDITSRPYTIEPTSITNKKVKLTKAKVEDGLITWIYIVNEDESIQGWAQYEILQKYEYDTGEVVDVDELETDKRQDYVNNNVIEMYFGDQLKYTAGY